AVRAGEGRREVGCEVGREVGDLTRRVRRRSVRPPVAGGRRRRWWAAIAASVRACRPRRLDQRAVVLGAAVNNSVEFVLPGNEDDLVVVGAREVEVGVEELRAVAAL